MSPFSQVDDLRAECNSLYHLLSPLDDAAYGIVTQFKGWTVHHVLAHLHMFNWAADASLRDAQRSKGPGDQFHDFYAALGTALSSGKSLVQATDDWLDEHENGTRGRELLDTWRDFYQGFCRRADVADPKLRVQWAGPEMSLRSSITARLMETWAHGQEIYDVLGEVRVDTDGIKNIAVLGINTFDWTFVNRQLPPPAPKPYVRLIAPSGEIWEWHEEQQDNRIEGRATEFCQVVTQTRNFADTELVAVGVPATQWMSVAQCFAGKPEDPPAPGTRHTALKPPLP